MYAWLVVSKRKATIIFLFVLTKLCIASSRESLFLLFVFVFVELYKKSIFLGETTAAKKATHWQRHCGNYIPGITIHFLGIRCIPSTEMEALNGIFSRGFWA